MALEPRLKKEAANWEFGHLIFHVLAMVLGKVGAAFSLLEYGPACFPKR
jgi:hypothetical protein